MNSIGFDLHKTYSQICILSSEGELSERRLRTNREDLVEFFSGLSRSRVVVESSTESEWVARCLEELGHEVVVADPNFAPMYSRRSRRVKTDRRDARAPAEAFRLGAYRRAHRVTDENYRLRVQLRARRTLVECRAKVINQIRSMLRYSGVHLPVGQPLRFAERVRDLDLSDWLMDEMGPMLEELELLSEKVVKADSRLRANTERDSVMRRLMTVPGVGPVTSAMFVSTLDRIERFGSAREVRSYLGLVPREMSSGERQRRGQVTKVGHRRTRSVLVEAAWSTYRSRNGGSLREWTDRIAARRGRRKAMVALARKLAGILYAIWRDESTFECDRSEDPALAA